MARVRIERILCPVDLSEPSRHALQHAVMLARWYGSQITVLQVIWRGVPPVPFGPPAIEPGSGELEALRDALRRFTDRDTTSGAAVTVKTLLRESPVVAGILDEARGLPADLIVMGTHGTSGFEHLILGSATEKVLRKAPCPVLTVPPAVTEAPPANGPFKTIVCALDFSAPSLRGLEFALSLAQESGGRLLALYVLDWPFDRVPTSDLSVETGAFRHQLEDEARRELHAAIPEEARSWCDITELMVTGKPYEQILRLAREHRADAIVLGVHGRNAVDLAFFGSTANHVVRAATCPVLTVRT